MDSLPNHMANQKMRRWTYSVLEAIQSMALWIYRSREKSWLNIVLMGLAIGAGIATYAALTETPPFGTDPKLVIWLLNIDLVILLIFLGLIGARIAALWQGRRRRVAGADLQVRIVAAFCALTAAPAIIMTVFAATFFHFGLQSWFSDQISLAVEESRAVAEAYLEEHQQVMRADILAMANDLQRHSLVLFENRDAFQHMLETQSFIRNLSEVVVMDMQGRILVQTGLTFSMTLDTIPDWAFEKAQEGDVVLMTGGNQDRVRALVQLTGLGDMFLFVGRMVDPAVLEHIQKTEQAVTQYGQLEARLAGLQLTMTMIFIVVATLLVMAAIWFGLAFGSRIVEPIGALMGVSERIRSGDLDARVPENGGIDEFDAFARSFNKMTSEIQQQRDALVSANRQLDSRRRFTEVILAGVSAGVISIDENFRVTLANKVAEDMFATHGVTTLLGRRLNTLIPDLKPVLENVLNSPGHLVQLEQAFDLQGGGRRIYLIRIESGVQLEAGQGMIVTFDDITQLQSAQRKAAWADVARRIAHEIKNPLTPIQLSAERLKRKYAKHIKHEPDIFVQCIETITSHVADIESMVSEFSAFARMPDPVIEPADLVRIVNEINVFFSQAHEHIEFMTRVIDPLPDQIVIPLDIRQLRQVLTNVVQNAIDSLDDAPRPDPKISLTLAVSPHSKNTISVVIQDNGTGFPADVSPESLSEPYVTRKKKGTGLGLAIVRKIMEDHGGALFMVKDPAKFEAKGVEILGGAVVSLDFPAAGLLKAIYNAKDPI